MSAPVCWDMEFVAVACLMDNAVTQRINSMYYVGRKMPALMKEALLDIGWERNHYTGDATISLEYWHFLKDLVEKTR